MPVRLRKSDACLADREWRLSRLYKIRDENRQLVNLDIDKFPNQRKLFDILKSLNFRGIRILIPKSRKMGVSTFFLLMWLDDTIFTPNTTTCIIAHTKTDVQKLLHIVKTAYENMPSQIRLSDGRVWKKPLATTENKNELSFDEIGSRIFVAIQSRGDTPNNLHISEAAHIADEDRILATLGAVPSIQFGSNISIESTCNGMGGWFQTIVTESEAGHSNFMLVFLPWFAVPKYALPVPSDWQAGKTELELQAKVKERHGIMLSMEQLYWWHRTKKDQGQLMDQEFPTFLEDAFLASGRLAFDDQYLRLIRSKPPIRVMDVEIDRIIPRNDGVTVTTHKEKVTYGVDIFVEPKKNHRYVLGGDPAEGINQDNSVIEVIDVMTLEQVAEFVCGSIPPKEFAHVVDKVCRYYNMALAAIERNNHGGTVLEELKLIYPYIYKREAFDEKTRKKTSKLGFVTDSHTRDLILDQFDQLLRECNVIIHSAILRAELFTFIVNEDDKREAKPGTHDDTIMASAIALKVARLPRSTFVITPLT